jgi:hypothetical protein
MLVIVPHDSFHREKSGRRPTNPLNAMLVSSQQVLWHCLILWLFFILKVSPALVLVALLKEMGLLMAPFCSQRRDSTH